MQRLQTSTFRLAKQPERARCQASRGKASRLNLRSISVSCPTARAPPCARPCVDMRHRAQLLRAPSTNHKKHDVHFPPHPPCATVRLHAPSYASMCRRASARAIVQLLAPLYPTSRSYPAGPPSA
eukprot:358902-Chlamydomonas_euryale.AAC.2